MTTNIGPRSERLTHLKVLPTPLPPAELERALDSFLLDCEARRLTAPTLAFYRQQLEPFTRHLDALNHTMLDAITPNDIRSYLVELQNRELADNSIHAAARAIKAFLNFCVREELLDASPMRKVRMPKRDDRILPAFGTDEVKRILDACLTPRDRAIVFCLLDSGCRVAEFVKLDVGDLDMKTGALQVHQGKGRKDRVTFIGAKARKALSTYLAKRSGYTPADPMWITDEGTRLSLDGLENLLKRLAKRSGIKTCHAHTFRRTFALWSLRSGMDIFSLQRLMGHSDLTVLRRYLALVERDLADAHRKYGAVDNML